MASDTDNMVCKLELDKKTYLQLCENIRETARDRKKAQKKLNDADFAAGAMTVMSQLGIKLPMWPLLIMSGRDWLEDVKPKNDKKE